MWQTPAPMPSKPPFDSALTRARRRLGCDVTRTGARLSSSEHSIIITGTRNWSGGFPNYAINFRRSRLRPATARAIARRFHHRRNQWRQSTQVSGDFRVLDSMILIAAIAVGFACARPAVNWVHSYYAFLNPNPLWLGVQIGAAYCVILLSLCSFTLLALAMRGRLSNLQLAPPGPGHGGLRQLDPCGALLDLGEGALGNDTPLPRNSARELGRHPFVGPPCRNRSRRSLARARWLRTVAVRLRLDRLDRACSGRRMDHPRHRRLGLPQCS